MENNVKAAFWMTIAGAALLAAGFLGLSYHELRCQVSSNTALIQHLEKRLDTESRPLVVVSGKYSEIIATSSEVAIVEEDKQ